jgi:hypothetical protein
MAAETKEPTQSLTDRIIAGTVTPEETRKVFTDAIESAEWAIVRYRAALAEMDQVQS